MKWRLQPLLTIKMCLLTHQKQFLTAMSTLQTRLLVKTH